MRRRRSHGAVFGDAVDPRPVHEGVPHLVHLSEEARDGLSLGHGEVFVEVRDDDPVAVVCDRLEVVFPPVRDGAEEQRLALPDLVEDRFALEDGAQGIGRVAVHLAARVHHEQDVLARDAVAVDVVVEEVRGEVGGVGVRRGGAGGEEDARVRGVEAQEGGILGRGERARGAEEAAALDRRERRAGAPGGGADRRGRRGASSVVAPAAGG